MFSEICFSLDQSKVLLSVNRLKMAQMEQLLLDSVEDILGKADIASNKHFVLYHPHPPPPPKKKALDYKMQ